MLQDEPMLNDITVATERFEIEARLYDGQPINITMVASGGSGGVTVHNLLSGRDAEDSHPIEAITGLQDELDSKIETEVDPVFSVSEASQFVAGDKALLDSALQSETDPIFSISEASQFVAGDKALLDSALQSESDPVFSASEASQFVAGDKALLDSALQSVVAGDNITIDNTDPVNPIISASGGGGSSSEYAPFAHRDEMFTNAFINTSLNLTPIVSLGRAGVMALRNGTTSFNSALRYFSFANVLPGTSYTTAGQFTDADMFDIEMVARLVVTTGYTTLWWGLADNPGTVLTTNGYYFEFQSGNIVCRAGGITYDTGIAVDNSFHFFRIRKINEIQIEYSIDGVLVWTASPQGIGGLTMGGQLQSTTTTLRQIEFDTVTVYKPNTSKLTPFVNYSGDTGLIAPSTAISVSGSGDFAWATPSGVTLAPPNKATATLQGTDTSEYLRMSGFGWEIPEDAVITGIYFEFTQQRTGGSSGNVRDAEVVLFNGLTKSDNKGKTSVNWQTTFNNQTYGGVGDTWGLTLTGADVMSSDFSVNISVTAPTSPANRIGEVYIPRLRIYYTV